MEYDCLYKVVAKLSVILFIMVSCTSCEQKIANMQSEKIMDTKTIKQVLEENTDKWMLIDGVIGTAIGELDDKPCITILVVEKTPEIIEKIPSTIEGYPIVIEQSGEIKALDD